MEDIAQHIKQTSTPAHIQIQYARRIHQPARRPDLSHTDVDQFQSARAQNDIIEHIKSMGRHTEQLNGN